MSSRFWNWTSNLTPGETARAGEVDANFSQINAAFALVAAELNRALRVAESSNPGLTEQDLEMAETAAQRAGKVLGADANGKPTWINPSLRWRGGWTSSTAYAVNDIVRAGAEGSLYICTTNHTSSGSFSTDVGTKWSLMIDMTTVRQFIRTFQIITAAQSPYSASAGDDLMVDVSSGPVTITLPASPSISDQPISVTHIGGNIASNNITIARNGKLLMGLAEDMTVSDANAAFELAFSNDTYGWRLVRGT